MFTFRLSTRGESTSRLIDLIRHISPCDHSAFFSWERSTVPRCPGERTRLVCTHISGWTGHRGKCRGGEASGIVARQWVLNLDTSFRGTPKLFILRWRREYLGAVQKLRLRGSRQAPHRDKRNQITLKKKKKKILRDGNHI